MKKHTLLKITAVTLLAAMVLCLAGCVTGREKLRVACCESFEPYGYYNGSKLTGIDTEISMEIAKKLGMKCELTAVPYDLLITSVESGDYDIGIGAITATNKFREKVDFTDSYITSSLVVLVKKDGNIQMISDLFFRENAVIGAIADTGGYMYTKWDFEDTGLGSVQSFSTTDDALAALQNVECDCLLIEKNTAEMLSENNDGLEILNTGYSTEQYAIAVGKTNPELKEKINSAIAELAADGTIGIITDKYIK